MSPIFDVPKGMALACLPCKWIIPEDITIGVLAAHFEAEHQTTEVTVELVVVCRCGTIMNFEGSLAGRDTFGCPQCQRSRTIRRDQAQDLP